MPKRTREHELEDQSRHALRGLFLQAGWTVQDLHHDYGEDLFVRIFKQGQATHWTFFVQAKATDHIARYRSKDGKSLNFPIDRDHLDSWVKFWEPVILTLWDAQADVTYWVAIQDVLAVGQPAVSAPKKKVSIRIPTSNTLDRMALTEIAALTVDQFARWERERIGAELLVGLLKKALHAVAITYLPQWGVLTIAHSHPNNVLQLETHVFGLSKEQVIKRATKRGVSTDQLVREIAQGALEVAESPETTGNVTLHDAAGNILKTFDTKQDYERFIRGLSELIREGFEFGTE